MPEFNLLKRACNLWFHFCYNIVLDSFFLYSKAYNSQQLFFVVSVNVAGRYKKYGEVYTVWHLSKTNVLCDGKF